MARCCYVYILCSRNRVLYVGVTNDLPRRLWQHRQGQPPGFASRYRAFRLVHFEVHPSPGIAIAREKQLKGWSRQKKLALVDEHNPDWVDLSADWEV
ncbi:MAG: GIY-YIG nuclease family protein [Armatimonadetes bacterium]|nr:GIY-YIG nuclease family protein [Armatimonadota bacterium]